MDTHAQLSDKVGILSEGLDDKVMEVLKLSVLGHAQNQGKVTEDSYCAVQFTERIDGELHFRIQADNETFLSSISEEAYQVFAEALVPKSHLLFTLMWSILNGHTMRLLRYLSKRNLKTVNKMLNPYEIFKI